jgi:hypothetical protein
MSKNIVEEIAVHAVLEESMPETSENMRIASSIGSMSFQKLSFP